MLALHIVAAVPADPHVSAHAAVLLQLTRQSPWHVTVQLDESRQITEPPSRSSLQSAVEAQVTSAAAPSLKSHFELPLHAMMLSSPPAPVHCDESLQDRLSWAVVLASQVAAFEQSTRQGPSPHVVLQLVPAAQVHSPGCWSRGPVHAHPVPVQVGAPSPPLHAANVRLTSHASRISQS